MVRVIVAGLALFAANPASAQDSGLPLWMVGTWCLELPIMKVCTRYDAPVDGAIHSTHLILKDGDETPSQKAVIRVEDGRVVYRISDTGSILREVSRAPDALVMDQENPGPLRPGRTRYAVSGDIMTVEMASEGSAPPTVIRLHKQP